MALIYRIAAITFLVTSLVSHADPQETGDKKMHGSGMFTVQTLPQEGSDFEKAIGIARVGFEKEWTGVLTGSSQCEMLAITNEGTGAMAYVAMERFVGKLNGHSGSFNFTHIATMQKGDPDSGLMKVVVVKNSGTEELRGLSGELQIQIQGGKHLYSFTYELPGH